MYASRKVKGIHSYVDYTLAILMVESVLPPEHE